MTLLFCVLVYPLLGICHFFNYKETNSKKYFIVENEL